MQTDDVEPRAFVHGPASDPDDSVTVVSEGATSTMRRMLDFRRESAMELRSADILDVHFALYGLLPSLVRPSRTSLVVHFHGPWADESVAAGRGRDGRVAILARRAVERIVYRQATAHVSVSHAFRRLLIERYGIKPWDAHVIHPGVDLERFSPGSRSESRERIGLSATSFVAVCARRLVPRTGVGVLLEAWADERLPSDRQLLIVGDGADREELSRTVDRLRLGERVRFLGRVDDVTLVNAYRAADVAVLPSLALEGFGLVVLEALACGVPVVATRVGGLPEALDGLDRSLVVQPQDPDALVRRLTGPFPDPAACRAWAEGSALATLFAATRQALRRGVREVDAAEDRFPRPHRSDVRSRDHAAPAGSRAPRPGRRARDSRRGRPARPGSGGGWRLGRSASDAGTGSSVQSIGCPSVSELRRSSRRHGALRLPSGETSSLHRSGPRPDELTQGPRVRNVRSSSRSSSSRLASPRPTERGLSAASGGLADASIGTPYRGV